MHSHCFKQHTQEYYTCPLCLKSLGDMAVYIQVCISASITLTANIPARCTMPLRMASQNL